MISDENCCDIAGIGDHASNVTDKVTSTCIKASEETQDRGYTEIFSFEVPKECANDAEVYMVTMTNATEQLSCNKLNGLLFSNATECGAMVSCRVINRVSIKTFNLI